MYPFLSFHYCPFTTTFSHLHNIMLGGQVTHLLHQYVYPAGHVWAVFFVCLQYAVVLVYITLVVLLLVILIGWLAPAYGSSNIMVYVSICSLLGSFTVPCCKGLGLAAQDAFDGSSVASNRAVVLFLGLLGTLIVSILIQFTFINRALERFSSHMFEALYYVTFTSTVILASAILFREWTSVSIVDCLGMLCGLTTVSIGVALLRISQDALLTWKQTKMREKVEWFMVTEVVLDVMVMQSPGYSKGPVP